MFSVLPWRIATRWLGHARRAVQSAILCLRTYELYQNARATKYLPTELAVGLYRTLTRTYKVYKAFLK
jgi:hypothetical protein